jgi:portal protein
VAAGPFTGGAVPAMGVQLTARGQVAEALPTDFLGFAVMAATNGPIFACMAVRQQVFSAARFQWQQLNQGRPGSMFGTAELGPTETPWPGGTTQDLLTRMIQDADLAGNSYWAFLGGEMVRMRPDWVQIVLEARMVRGAQLGWRKVGYLYWEQGVGVSEPVALLVDEVAHFAPQPDPLATFRGMSWLTPVAREVQADNMLSTHKRRYLENAATPNLVVRMAKEVSPDAFEKFKAKMDATHRGVDNAYKTLYLGGGADVTVAGSNFQQLEFTAVQGAGESRIASAAGVPPIIVGFSEGLKAATYSNYGQARRRLADATIHPLWQNAAGTLGQIIVPPARLGGNVRLWYDARDVPFLREDRKDAADIQGVQARSIRTLVDAGYTPDSVQRAVDAEDWSLLVHTGLFSVQLQPPGSGGPPAAVPALPSGSQEQ